MPDAPASRSSRVGAEVTPAPIRLDHLSIPARDRVAAARLLAQALGVPWAEDGAIGAYSPVYVNSDLTLDFFQCSDTFLKQHCCFRVGPETFAAIVQRLRHLGIRFRSTAQGPDDGEVAQVHGGQRIYWREPEGHVWELLTASYKRRPPVDPSRDRP